MFDDFFSFIVIIGGWIVYTHYPCFILRLMSMSSTSTKNNSLLMFFMSYIDYLKQILNSN